MQRSSETSVVKPFFNEIMFEKSSPNSWTHPAQNYRTESSLEIINLEMS